MAPKPPPNEPEGFGSGRSPSLAPHPDYYIRGGDLYFLLRQTLYRVHSHFFIRESKFWKNELAGPVSPGDGPLLKGSSPTNAIVLDEDPRDFDCLLWVFYNTKFGDYSKAKLQEWIAILRYATRWEFPDVRELAIQHLQNHEMHPVSRIRLYQDNQLPEKYLFPLYVQLAQREELLVLKEAQTLGMETLVLIYQARERLRTQPPMNNRMLSPIRTDLKPVDVVEIVSATFNISLADVDLTSDVGTDGAPPTAGAPGLGNGIPNGIAHGTQNSTGSSPGGGAGGGAGGGGTGRGAGRGSGGSGKGRGGTGPRWLGLG